MCSACFAGFNPKNPGAGPGVIHQLSTHYPNLKIIINDPVRGIVKVQNGLLLD